MWLVAVTAPAVPAVTPITPADMPRPSTAAAVTRRNLRVRCLKGKSLLGFRLVPFGLLRLRPLQRRLGRVLRYSWSTHVPRTDVRGLKGKSLLGFRLVPFGLLRLRPHQRRLGRVLRYSWSTHVPRTNVRGIKFVLSWVPGLRRWMSTRLPARPPPPAFRDGSTSPHCSCIHYNLRRRQVVTLLTDGPRRGTFGATAETPGGHCTRGDAPGKEMRSVSRQGRPVAKLGAPRVLGCEARPARALVGRKPPRYAPGATLFLPYRLGRAPAVSVAQDQPPRHVMLT